MAGRDKEGELATTSLGFDYLHRKSRCVMLIGGDDIRNEALPLARVFQCLFPLRADWRRSDSSVDGESGNHKGIGGGIDGGNSNSRGVVASSRPFPAPPPERNRAWLHVHVAWSAHCQILLRFQLFHILQESNQWNR